MVSLPCPRSESLRAVDPLCSRMLEVGGEFDADKRGADECCLIEECFKSDGQTVYKGYYSKVGK